MITSYSMVAWLAVVADSLPQKNMAQGDSSVLVLLPVFAKQACLLLLGNSMDHHADY